MPDPWYVLEITGECRNRFWHGPFEDSEEGTGEDFARSFAYSLYTNSQMDLPQWFINPHAINSEQRYFRRVWWGQGRTRFEGDKLFVFIGTGFEVFARDLDGLWIITDSQEEQDRADADAETVDYCAGPFVDDWCEPCEDVTALADGFSASAYSPGQILPIPPDGVDFYPNHSGSAPYLYETLVSPLQAEVDGLIATWGTDYDSWVSSGGDNTVYAAFGYNRVARITHETGGFAIMEGYPNTNFGELYYVPDSLVESWLASECLVNFTWPEHPDYLPFDPLAEAFDEPAIYLVGYDVKVELFAQVVSGGTDYGTCFTARSQYDIAYYNQIVDNPGYAAYVMPRTIHTEFIPAGEDLSFSKNWWGQPWAFCTLPVGFRHTNELDGKIIGEMVGPWALAVNFQITPVFKAANGYSSCDREMNGETQAITVIGRCPREAYQRPFPYPGIGTSDNPNFHPWPFTYGMFREVAGVPENPAPKYKREMWGWSGNGIDFPTLLVLNPTWALNAFIDNWPPFKRVPYYKKMVEFIRYITGKRSQYQSIGTDPETGWEVYPVPVIVGADGSGFPVYGEPVYKLVQSGGSNL